MTKTLTLLERFRGGMVGGVIGDCLGAPVECQFWDGIPMAQVKKHFQNYKQRDADRKLLAYTDDTAMARQVAGSIIQKKAVDAKHMAKCFVHEYFNEPHRGYGAAVSEVFKKLRSQGCELPFEPASAQFDGSGSYGNGAAMRVHPLGLFCYDKPVDCLAEEVANSAKITHTNADGVNGAVLQAACVAMAAQGLPIDDIMDRLLAIGRGFPDPNAGQAFVHNKKKKKCDTYSSLLSSVKKAIDERNFDVDSLIDVLGNDVSALNSVPAAIYSFLAGSFPESVESVENAFERTLHVALAFGGDSDTICSMAGAIAGAYYGEPNIPPYMLKICEAVPDAMEQANKLHDLVYSEKTSNIN